MDILSLIDKFIQWCDGNVGFLNVILSLCTLILTVTIAKLPYKKKKCWITGNNTGKNTV